MNANPLVSVVIPNWNGAVHLPRCLDALRKQTYSSLEIVVVDNASVDNSRKLLTTYYPDVLLIPLDENLGFTGACNVGMSTAVGEIVVLLNNDTEAGPAWAAGLVRAFERYPEAGIAASKIMLMDRRNIFHAAGDFYGVDGIPGNRGVWERDGGQYDEEAFVFSACGGAAAYRRTLLEEIGLLDEDFFFSCEDVDLAWRAQLAGWRCIYTPDAVVYHALSATGGGVTASYHNGRNFIYVITKNYPTPLLYKYWWRVLAGQLKITLKALRHIRGKEARATLRGQWAGLLGIRRMLRKRRRVQQSRKVTIEYLESILSLRSDR